MLVWCDLESTGLDAQKEHLLEVACIVTDDALNVVARFERVVYWEHAIRVAEHVEWVSDPAHPGRLTLAADDASMWQPDGLPDLDPVVVKMHAKTGLWGESARGQARDTVDRELAAFIKQHAVKDVPTTDPQTGETKTRVDLPQLAGSTISFDRAFIAAHLPRTLATLHYRNVDVSSFNETARRFWKPIFDARPRTSGEAKHRAMADIEESIAVYKHYIANIGPLVVGGFVSEGGELRSTT